LESSAFPFCSFPVRIEAPANCIPAIPITSGVDGPVELGPITQLPQAARLQVCGMGFNDLTVKVWWEGRYYFVFLEDLPDNQFRKLAQREFVPIPDVSQIA
jgi:hypothetical protein